MSNKQQIETSLKSLILDDDRAFVAMLSGEWGIGKTYFWNEFTKNHLKDKNVVYISLFGKNSLADIETEIVTKLYKYNKGLKKYTKHLDTIGNMASKAMGLPINVSIGSLLSLFKTSDFRNTIICFDDFERLSDKVALKDVMGLISQFKEQKECKVILILNEQELDKLSNIDGKKHDEIFALYKEKVVDYNFHYIPNQEELFEAIKEDIDKINFCEHQTIYNFFTKIDLKNIRIMTQAIYQLSHFNFIKDYSLDKKVVNEFVDIALNLFVFKAKSNYTYSNFIDMQNYTPKERQESLRRMVNQRNKIDTKKDIPINVNQKHEDALNDYHTKDNYSITEYQSSNKDVIEKIIYDFIDSHRLSKTDLQKELEQNNQSLEWYDVRNEISELHTRFYTDFSVSNSEIAKQLFSLLSKYKDVMHRLFQYDSYKPFMEIINQFSPAIEINALKEEIAKNYINFYIENPSDDVHGPVDYEGGQLRLLTSNYDWAGKYIKEYKKKSIQITPKYILSLIEKTLSRRYLSDEDAFKLNQISTKEYQKLIKENPNLIQPLVKFLKMPDSKNVRENIIDALKSLKKENDDYKWKVAQIFKSSGITIEGEK
jgi:hypothetical protein